MLLAREALPGPQGRGLLCKKGHLGQEGRRWAAQGQGHGPADLCLQPWVCSSLSPQWPPDPLKGQRCPSPSKHTLSGVNSLPHPPPPPQISSLQDRVLPWEMAGSAGLDLATRIISLERGSWGPQPEPTLTLRG